MFSDDFIQELCVDEKISEVPITYQSIVIHSIERIIEQKSKDGICVSELCLCKKCERCIKNV